MVDFINNADATGSWTLDEPTLNISGGNPQSMYGTITVTQIATGGMANLELNTNLIPNGSTLWLNVGTHELIFTDANQCADTLTVEVYCIMIDKSSSVVSFVFFYFFLIKDVNNMYSST